MAVHEAAIERDAFGKTADGVAVDRYTLRNSGGLTVRLITYGATVTELWTPDRQGAAADVVLGFDRLSQYETQSPYFGCTVGRVAFRIARGEFVLDGRSYQLTLNDGLHHLHGGLKGFSHVVWQAEPLPSRVAPAVRFTYRSPDGDQGYPGTLDVAVVYTLSEDDELRIDYTATTDRPTPVNLTHHSYFNLAGAGSGDVLGHALQIDADRWIPAEQPDLPSGEIASVTGTPFDFTRPTAIGARLHQIGGQAQGYDLAYLHNHPEGSLARVASVHEPLSGRSMAVSTDEPALVLYTGNYLDGSLVGKGGAAYARHAGVCLETGRPPDAVHHPHFPATILRPGQVYRHTCVYRFSTR
jgi:aldose 1-epimerase